MASDVEADAMRRAITLAAAALGSTNPNPCVGAVVLDPAGGVVGEGVTQGADLGGDHAEVCALRAAGSAARGGTIVVTLEPCRHTGRTPPCTERVVDAGIARVVFAVHDPNQIAAGGSSALRERGIDVEAGVLADEAMPALGRWLTGISRRRPHLTWKYAATLDGRVAAADGSSRWITGDVARRDVHHERYLADAVLVGIGTVLADDPQLTVRDWPASRQPLRVVLDSDARTPVTARVLDAGAPSLVVVAEDVDPSRAAAIAATGAEVLQVPRRDGHVALDAVLAALFDRSVAIGFLEGGPTVAAALVRAGLVDRVVGYHAPLLLGGGPSLACDLGVATLSDAVRLTLDEVRPVGDDVRIDATIRSRSS
jgi:diaminohydroxyphosphoribosylaminopyrimidine deaminase/5-amino-6-(5-phosphoribosylamino)uracil reductase